MDNNFDTRRRKFEAIQDYINREEVTTLSLQNETNIVLGEKMRGYCLVRASVLTEQVISGYPNHHTGEHWTV